MKYNLCFEVKELCYSLLCNACGELYLGIQTMMKDQYANYVVQKIIDISNENQRERLLNCIQLHLVALKKYTYGKHIVARFEQLTNEGITDE